MLWLQEKVEPLDDAAPVEWLLNRVTKIERGDGRLVVSGVASPRVARGG
jgi:hypothetical protein